MSNTVSETIDVALSTLALGSLPVIMIAAGVAAVGDLSISFRGPMWLAIALNAAALVRLKQRSDRRGGE